MAITVKKQRLTARQQKAYVQKITGWSTSEYNKQYDRLRNRTRNYERAAGLPKGSINVADLLANNERSKAMAGRYKETYRPTYQYQAIQKVTSASTGAKLTQAQLRAGEQAAFEAINNRYRGAIEKNKLVQDALRSYQESGKQPTPAEYEQAIIQALRTSDAITERNKKLAEEFGKKGIAYYYDPNS